MQTKDPFIISKRKDSKYYQVRFKNPDKSSPTKYLPARTTGETDEIQARIKAWQMFNNETPKKQSLFDIVKNSDYSAADVTQIMELFKQRGFITEYIMPDTPQAIGMIDFMINFWTYDISPYIREKNRNGNNITISYVNESRSLIIRFWKPYFTDKLFGELTRKDLKKFIDYIDTFDLSWNRKLKIYRAGTIAIKWAYNNELISRDITAGISSFSGKNKKRNILTKEMAELLFSFRWDDNRVQLANLIAMLTGMRLGEIRALRVRNLGNNCLYVENSWNRVEHLKSTKNGDCRTVRFPFPKLIEKMKLLASYNPNYNLDTFIFWSVQKPDQPLDSYVFLKKFRRELHKCGITELECKNYTFHAWRHFYTSYMASYLPEKTLQSQTGHKTVEMLEHYSNHQISGEVQKIEESQKSAFGDILSKSYLSIL